MSSTKVDKLLEIIDNNYYFDKNYDIWEKIKKALSENNEEISFYNLRKLISSMHDPHLSIRSLNNEITLLIDIFCKENHFWINEKNECKEILQINDESIEKIYLKYKEDFEENAMDFFIDDIRRGNFLKNGIMVLSDKNNEKIFFEGKSIKELLKDNERMQFVRKPLYYKNIKEKYLLLKIPFFENDNLILETEKLLDYNNMQKIEYLIIDLRDNFGGKIGVANKFVQLFFEGSFEYPFYFQTIDNEKKILHVFGTRKESIKDKRLVLFINSRTCSCAEFIVAIALKEIFKDNIIVVGEPTRGMANIAIEVCVDDVLLTYTKYRLIEKNKNVFFDCTILPTEKIFSSDYNDILKIYNGDFGDD